MDIRGKIGAYLGEIRSEPKLVNKYEEYMYLLSDKEALENMSDDEANNLLESLEKDYNDYFSV